MDQQSKSFNNWYVGLSVLFAIAGGAVLGRIFDPATSKNRETLDKFKSALVPITQQVYEVSAEGNKIGVRTDTIEFRVRPGQLDSLSLK